MPTVKRPVSDARKRRDEIRAANLAKLGMKAGSDEKKERAKLRKAAVSEADRLASGDRTILPRERKNHSRREVEEIFPRGAAEDDFRYNWRRNKGEVPPCFSSEERETSTTKLKRRNTIILSSAILDTAAAYGFDGNGLGGIRGYLRRYMEEFPQDFFDAVMKTLPMTVKHEGEVGIYECRTIEEARKALEIRGLGSIDHIYEALSKRSKEHGQSSYESAPILDQPVVDVECP